MAKVRDILICSAFILTVIILGSNLGNLQPLARAVPNLPYQGSGNNIDVHDFARNVSSTFSGKNGTTFIYYNTWYPSGYRGYRLQADLSQIRRFTDPLPNGSFENTTAFSSTWNLTNLEPGDPIVKAINNVTGQDPTDGIYVMDMELPYKKLLGERTAYIDNDFNYTSEFFPDEVDVEFDIKLEDITDKDWLELKIEIWNQGERKGYWHDNTKDLKDQIGEGHWSHQTIPISDKSLNGPIKLRITLRKNTFWNENVKGHIYFDNFMFIIGSDVKPSEAALTLNGEPVLDSPSGPSGTVNVYADPSYGEEIPWANCWGTDQLFQFISPTYDNLTYYYEYSMYVKNVTLNAATTSFKAPVNNAPTWNITYVVPSGLPPSGHQSYSFGLYLQNTWQCTLVNDSGGTLLSFTVDPASNFLKLGEDEASAGETISIYATSLNHVKAIYPQKGPTALGPWENITAGGYYVKDNYLRVMAELEPFTESPSDYANISIFYPNGTLWHTDDSDNSVDFNDTANSLVSTSWQITDVDDNILGQNWIIEVSYDNGTQCGKRQALFTVVVDTVGNKIQPTDGDSFYWGDSIRIEVTWENAHTGTPITDASMYRVRYLDRNLVVQYVTMTTDGLGGYWTDFSTTLMSPDPNAQIHVELFRYGCLNASYAEGTQITFTVNLINKINLVMIKPTQQTGPNEYTGETSAGQGFSIIVKFYDPFQGAYVLNESAIWPAIHVNYTYYYDPTGPTSWTFGGTGSFSHNTLDRTFYQKNSSLTSIDSVRYEVSMRIEGASWNYQTHDFTIIFNIVSWATDLDALRTIIDYPPIGDGWTIFDQSTDSYEVHVYWDETFNVTVFYHYAENTTEISLAEVKIQIGSSPLQDMAEVSNGYYHYIVDTSSLNTGLTTLYVNATKADHATETILIQLFVDARQTELTKDQPGSTVIIHWGGSFSVTFTFTDIVETLPIGIPDALVTVEITPTAIPYSIVNHTDGTYTITFTGNTIEETFSIIINFSCDKYQSKSQHYALTIRLIATQSTAIANTPSVPWGDDAIITLNFTDLDNSIGVFGGVINFTSHGIWEVIGQDYWLIDQGNGLYILTLNTTKVSEGTNGYTLIFTFTKDHYQVTQTAVFFQVRDIQTILFIKETPKGTIIPYGDIFYITLQFNDTDHSNTCITGAVIGITNWDPFFWSSSYNAIEGTYEVMIRTEFSSEGSYVLNIWANKAHYREGTNIQNFVIQIIQTSVSTRSDNIVTPIGDNVTFSLDYEDDDHLDVFIPGAGVSINWPLGFYTITDLGNGTYRIELNTTCGSVGNYALQVNLELPPHYEAANLYITLDITSIPLNIDVLEPITGQWDVEYNTLIFITVNLTDHNGNPINDATVAYRWAGRDLVNMTFLGNGIYNVTFLANASVGFNHQVTIQAFNLTKYDSVIAAIFVIIRPTDTVLDNITPITMTTVIGESFTISVSFTTINGLPIDEANINYVLRNRSGDLLLMGDFNDVGAGIYNATLDPAGLLDGEYTIYVSASKATMSEQQLTIKVVLEKIPTIILSGRDQIPVLTNTPFAVSVTLNDAYHDVGIADATLTITIADYGIFNVPMTNHQNGTYSYEGLSGPLEGNVFIIIDAYPPIQYQTPESKTIILVVQLSPFMQNIGLYISIATVIVIVLLILWFAYARVFSVPWMVRKMRKMSKTIGKGATPLLSKREIGRISGRSNLMTELVEPAYEVIGVKATTIVVPAEIDWKEREAEDEAIWAKLKTFPFLEHDQKLKLFQEMKQIPASERVWFLEDMKQQMTDSTRFARKPKELETPKISVEFEEELQRRLATFPALSKAEKERVAAQLRQLPKEDWDEVFQTFAEAQPPPKVEKELLRPDEFPTLSEKERKKLLEELRGLSEEERQKVLQTFREQRVKISEDAKVIKKKKKFVIDDSDKTEKK